MGFSPEAYIHKTVEEECYSTAQKKQGVGTSRHRCYANRSISVIVAFSNIQRDIEMDADSFKFVIPHEVEVIDFSADK